MSRAIDLGATYLFAAASSVRMSVAKFKLMWTTTGHKLTKFEIKGRIEILIPVSNISTAGLDSW
jgi:hypothetical protein